MNFEFVSDYGKTTGNIIDKNCPYLVFAMGMQRGFEEKERFFS
ncbi:hypothetical protein [Akkermansia muciniphila]|nr:hypothetical protein [Akkermansia muciniphila]